MGFGHGVDELDADTGAAGAEADFVAVDEALGGDALAFDPSAVLALEIDEQPAAFVAAELGVVAARVEIVVGVEDDVVVGGAADLDDLLVDRLDLAGVLAEGVDEAEPAHGFGTPRRRSTRIAIR